MIRKYIINIIGAEIHEVPEMLELIAIESSEGGICKKSSWKVC